jgi:type III pantothenate kinase
MRQSLGIATAQLPKIDACAFTATETPREIFAKNTAEAIYTGTLHAISGAIEHMAHELNLQSKQVPHIVISGGDAKVIKDTLARYVTNQTIIVDNLVLHGLYLLEKSTPD